MKRLFVLFTFIILFIFPKNEASAFSDVKTTDYFYDAVQWAQQEKIISGYSNGTFKPHNYVTHQQFIKMYTNSFDFGHPLTATAYTDYYNTLEEYGIIFNYTELTARITRGEVAALLAYANGQSALPYTFSSYAIEELYEPSAKYLIDANISTGQSAGATYAERFGVNKTLTRAQAITFLYRLNQKQLDKLTDNVKLYQEPFPFTEQDAVIRSYDVGNDITYHVLADEVNYRVVITYKKAVIGGYETEVGKTILGHKIGETFVRKEEDGGSVYYIFPSSGVSESVHVDTHENNTIRAVSWWVATPSMQEQVAYAKTLAASVETTNIAQIYRDLANEFRAKAGVHLLEEHWVLTSAAKAHSVDMANRDYFSHYTPEGLSPTSRVQLVPHNTDIFSAGENISAGYTSIFDSHTGLINSLGHRQNLLNEVYQYIGYGIGRNPDSTYKLYYTTKFSY